LENLNRTIVKKLKSSETITASIALLLILLMFSSTFTLLGNIPSSNALGSTNITQGATTERVDPYTGEPYGDLSQYTWVNDATMWSGGNAPEGTKYSAGPAPGRPDILWNVAERTDIGTFSAVDSWVGGYVICRSTKAGVNYIDALDPFTGSLEWQTPHPGVGAITVLNDQYFKVNTGTILSYDMFGNPVYDPASIKWMVFSIATGTFAFNTTTGVPDTGNILREENILFRTEINGTGAQTQWWVVAYDISDPQHGVPEAWRTSALWGGSSGFQAEPAFLCYGDGRIFFGSWGDFFIKAVNAKTGEIEWDVMGKIKTRDAVYCDGKLITSGVGTIMTAYDGATGNVVWEYDAGVRCFFANTGCAAYGMIFQHNMALPVGYFGAWNTTTGELVWKIPGWYYIGYFSPCVADGKIYMIISDGSPISERSAADTPPAYSACIDAFTGQILWTVPFQLGATGFGGMPRVAYGSLWYVTQRSLGMFGPYVDVTLWCVSDATTAPAWAMWRGNTDQPGVAVGQSGPSDISNYKWKYSTEGPIEGSAVVADGKVYFGSEDANIYCLDARVGSLIWKFQTGYLVRSTPAVVGGKLYTGTDDGNIYCLDAVTGDQVWKRTLGATYMGTLEYPFAGEWQMRSSPIIVSNRLYVGALNGKVYCLNTATGDTVWTYQTGYPIGGSAAYYNGTIYIPSVDMYLYALNAADGTLVWKTQVGVSIQYYTGMLTGTPLVVPSEGKIFIQNNGGGATPFDTSPCVRGYNLVDGTPAHFANGTLLSLPLGGSTPASSSPAWYKGLLYTVGYWRVQCWNVTSGTKLWQVYMGHQTFSSPSIADGIDDPKLYVGDEVGAIHCIDISNTTAGKSISVYAASGNTPGTPAIWERKIYLGWSDWSMYCFSDATMEDAAVSACLSTNAVDINKSESVTIAGKLYSPLTSSYTVSGVQYTYTYTPGLPLMPVLVSVGKPDGTRSDLTATTNAKGEFSVTYTPTVAGNYTLMAWFQGKDKVTYSYNYAYGDQLPLKATMEESTPPPPPPPEEEIPIEYVLAGIAIVVIVIVLAAAYMWMRRPKK
jgi:outer membrane protein assembly factor BamB